MRQSTLFAAVAIAAFGASSTASAALIRASTANCGGFSSCDDTAFVTAAAVPLTFNDFSVDRFGGALPASGNVAGNVYSADFTLSSAAGLFGGVNSTSVSHGNGSGATSEVGPASGYTGILDITFTNAVSALGFGAVQLGDNGVAFETISIYGMSGLLGSFNAISNGMFNYEGFVATGGDLITRAVLNGNFFGIENLKYAKAPVAVAVPEPTSLALVLVGALGLLARRRRLGSR
jgi:hypothetical protein